MVQDWYEIFILLHASVFKTFNSRKIAAAHSDGFISLSTLKDDDQLEPVGDWRETRFKADQRYVGLSACDRYVLFYSALHNNFGLLFGGRGIYSCTSNGALRMTKQGHDDRPMSHRLASLPTRLCDWRMSSDLKTCACGGDEVELSVWNMERAFAPAEQSAETQTKKRKRNDALFPGEIWRAKNVCYIFNGNFFFKY